MTNSSYEKRALEELEAQGHLVDKARATVFWLKVPGQPKAIPRSRANDFWNAFDINTLHPTGPSKHIQVTSHTNRAARRKKVVAAMGSLASNEKRELLLWSYGYQKRFGFHKREERYEGDGRWKVTGAWKYDGTPIVDPRALAAVMALAVVG